MNRWTRVTRGFAWRTDRVPAQRLRTDCSSVTGAAPPSRRERAKDAAVVMVCWVALLWGLEVIDVASRHALDTFGISPREIGELRDMVPAAFVHFGFAHLAANSVPLLLLGFLVALSGLRRLLAVVTVIILASGLGVWLDGTPALHDGRRLRRRLRPPQLSADPRLREPQRRRPGSGCSRRRGLRLVPMGRPSNGGRGQLARTPLRPGGRSDGGLRLATSSQRATNPCTAAGLRAEPNPATPGRAALRPSDHAALSTEGD